MTLFQKCEEDGAVIFDTDIIIWIQRGNKKAGELVDLNHDRSISIITYMELLQHAPSKQHQTIVKDYLREMDFLVLPLSDTIGHRASIYIEEYSLRGGISTDDAIIAATAIENNLVLASGNVKHYKLINELQLKRFMP
jgi:predicted nucleic acid-binding protein